MTDIIQIEFFRRTTGYTLYDHTRNEEILKELKIEPVVKLATTCTNNKNEQQGAKYNAEI